MVVPVTDELEELLRLEERLGSPAGFAEWASGGAWVAFPHLRLISSEIVDMIERDTCDVLLVEASVRHGKSELCSKFTPAWFVCQYPDWTVGLTSYEADFAQTWGRRARDVVEEVGREFGVRVNQRSSAASRWNIEGRAGGMWTAGAGGPLTGKGGALLVVDDPIKNAEEANSQGERDKLAEWFEKVLLTRRQGVGKVIVVMSRWHHDDLVGRLKVDPKGLRVRSVRLPAEAEEDDPLGREPGEPLCEELMSAERLAQAKQTSAWAGLYQQRPMAAEGALFSPAGFRRRYESVEQEMGDGERRRMFVLHTEAGDKVFSEDECHRFATVDLAVSLKTWADWTVVLSAAATPDGELLVLGVTRLRAESHEHEKLVADAIARHRLGWAGIEESTFGLSLLQVARRRGLPVRKLKADKDKVARARPAQAMVEGGMVFLPAGADWIDGFVRECVEFPLGRHDDQVDCLAYACKEVANGGVRAARQRRREVETTDQRVWRNVRSRFDDKGHRRHPVLGRF